jgi:hypothetical protein
MDALKPILLVSMAASAVLAGCASGPDETPPSNAPAQAASMRDRLIVWGPDRLVVVPDEYCLGNFEVLGRMHMEAPYLQEVGHDVIVYPEASLKAPLLKRVVGTVILMDGATLEAPQLTGATCYTHPKVVRLAASPAAPADVPPAAPPAAPAGDGAK